MMPYTLVRHTGFSVGGNSSFEHAVEERSVSTKKEERAIHRAGGLIYNSYTGARDKAMAYNYPDDGPSMICRARGKFVKRSSFDEEIFVPDNHLNP